MITILIYEKNKNKTLALTLSIIFTIILSLQTKIAHPHPSPKKYMSHLKRVTYKMTCMDDKNKWLAGGSGVAVEHTSGQGVHILTASHVVQGCTEKKGKLYATKEYMTRKRYGADINRTVHYSVTVVADDPDKDLTLVKTKIRYFGQRPVVKISRSFAYPGTEVYIAGWPSPIPALQFNYGIVSTDIKKRTENNQYVRYYVIDAYTYYGNSGGPVVNHNMDLIGIAVMITNTSGGWGRAQGPTRGYIVSNYDVWDFLREDSPEVYKKLWSQENTGKTTEKPKN